MRFQTDDNWDEPPAVIEYANQIRAVGERVAACEYCDATCEIGLVSPHLVLSLINHDNDCPRTGAPPRAPRYRR